jgi:uncharacterized protein YqgQ
MVCYLAQQEAVTGLLVKKGIFTKEEFLEMRKVVEKEMKKKKEGLVNDSLCSFL